MTEANTTPVQEESVVQADQDQASVERNEEPQPATITIDDVSYLRDSLGERGESMISNMQRISQKINDLQFDLHVAGLAQAKVSDDLKNELPNFTVAE
jgi:hypothetical protein